MKCSLQSTLPVSSSVRAAMLAATLLLPAIADAGPPLICHPFQTTGAELLPWGTGAGWNTPDPHYDVQRLPADTLRLLAPEMPVLARMEILRRAAIYAVADAEVADRLLQGLKRRALAVDASVTALFDAGYLIEAYRQSQHLHRRAVPAENGYALVMRALAKRPSAGLEFAASLMSDGATAQAHLRRARLGSASEPLLARNIEEVWR